MNLAQTEIVSRYLGVVEDAERQIGVPLTRFRNARFSFATQSLTEQNPIFFTLPGLSAKPYWDLCELPQIVQEALSEVERNYDSVLHEYCTAMSELRFDRGHTGYFGASSHWKQHDLVIKGGIIVDDVEKKHPTLYRFCRTLLDQHYLSGTFFATLDPGGSLEQHCGAFNHALRLHLGLIVPDGDCGLLTVGVARRWQAGKWLCFDDTFPHAAWNRTTSRRDILLARLLHPDLVEHERQAFYIIEQNPQFWRTYTLFKEMIR